MPNLAPATLDELLTRAEGYAAFAMRKMGQVAPVLFAATEIGEIWFLTHSLADVKAKNDFANTCRLSCSTYAATAAVLALESWLTMANPGESLEPDTPPSEAFDRRELH